MLIEFEQLNTFVAASETQITNILYAGFSEKQQRLAVKVFIFSKSNKKG